jgi:hypothetical protein
MWNNEELLNLHSSPNIMMVIEDDEVGGICSTHGEMTDAYTSWITEGGKHLGDPGANGKIILH